ncbi:hypothetical protein PRIPAC_92371 [Pristionchus pacificus]|uniref:Zinc finger protein n=1 Tax=Pristionchus pacificus TaxID=54126 RepID=A0A2A6BBR4_PRIPA|nr:hypothetical protein PRIPAC_92371 [Pristionchus pacificus]|eukprot:PDM63332.1 zinc finger protein [Pristionchus pacificus]
MSFGDAAASSSAMEDSSDASVCTICLDALDRKRIVILMHCKHQFHRTCALEWFEPNKDPSTHSCCLCRATVAEVVSENGSRVCRMFPFEEEEVYMKRLLRLHAYEADDDNIEVMKKGRGQILKDLKNLETEKELAKKERKCEEYIIDIDEERAKLEKRKCAIEMLITYYEEIRAAISSGCVELLNDAVIL